MLKRVGDIGKTGKLISTIKSDSTDEIYEIRTDEESSSHYTCTCMGYAISKKRPKTCKHLRRYFIIEILKSILASAIGDRVFINEYGWEEKAKAIERLFKKEL